MINYVFIPITPVLIAGSGLSIDPVVGIFVIIFVMWFISKMMKND